MTEDEDVVFEIDPDTNLITAVVGDKLKEAKLKKDIKKGSTIALEDIQAELQVSALYALGQIKAVLTDKRCADNPLVINNMVTAIANLKTSFTPTTIKEVDGNSSTLLTLVDKLERNLKN